jgi:hypothetical protein
MYCPKDPGFKCLPIYMFLADSFSECFGFSFDLQCQGVNMYAYPHAPWEHVTGNLILPSKGLVIHVNGAVFNMNVWNLHPR